MHLRPFISRFYHCIQLDSHIRRALLEYHLRDPARHSPLSQPGRGSASSLPQPRMVWIRLQHLLVHMDLCSYRVHLHATTLARRSWIHELYECSARWSSLDRTCPMDRQGQEQVPWAKYRLGPTPTCKSCRCTPLAGLLSGGHQYELLDAKK